MLMALSMLSNWSLPTCRSYSPPAVVKIEPPGGGLPCSRAADQDMQIAPCAVEAGAEASLIHPPLGADEVLLLPLLVVQTHHVETRLALGLARRGLGADPRPGRLVGFGALQVAGFGDLLSVRRGRLERQMAGAAARVVGTPDNHRPLRVAMEEADDHFLSDPRQELQAQPFPRPTVGNPHEAGVAAGQKRVQPDGSLGLSGPGSHGKRIGTRPSASVKMSRCAVLIPSGPITIARCGP